MADLEDRLAALEHRVGELEDVNVILPAAEIRKTWPHRRDVPMHFAHPRFGAALAGAG